MAEVDQVKARVRAQVARCEFIERLAERVGGRAQASAVFGEPVERSGLTVIPVAKATWGVGGGSGEKAGEHGLGGGGGMAVAPLGWIEVRDEGAVFKPIRDPRLMAGAGAAAAALTALAVRAILRR
jgi:uncharacterized spore protein YtfJ